MLNSEKSILRKKLLNIRTHFNPLDINLLSKQICAKLDTLDVFIKSKHIALYSSMDKEVHLDGLMNESSISSKQFYLPVVQQDWSLKFYPYKLNDTLTINHCGVYEPIPQSPAVALEQIDIIVLPMLGFCKSGLRLGMGKACYDRTLRLRNHPILIGVSFSAMEIDTFKQEPHDVLMDVIITEKNVYDISGKCG